MARSHRHAELIHEPEYGWPHGWWILPAIIRGAFVWVWNFRQMIEIFRG